MNENTDTTAIAIANLATTGYVFATISSASKYEDPRRLGRIYLDFSDSGDWVYREQVFTKDSDSVNYISLVSAEDSQKSNDELQLPPQGTLVVVLTIQNQ